MLSYISPKTITSILKRAFQITFFCFFDIPNKKFYIDNPYYESIKKYLIDGKSFKVDVDYVSATNTLTKTFGYDNQKIGIYNDIDVVIIIIQLLK